ncbi:MAG: hypothetical protein HRU38_06825 [Saccharospirillaceae bacterium]|nr:hypothetical protein [Saccharospirillaceae bacterium]
MSEMESGIQRVVSDDGSSGNKLIFRNKEGQLSTLLIDNTFTRKKNSGLHPVSKKPSYSYSVDGGRSYCWDIYGDDALSENLDFQMSEHSLFSTHIGLNIAGILGDVELICTVPINAFFNPTTFEVNDEVIKAKQDHMMRKVTPDNAALKTANIVSVKVMPECFPFVLQQLDIIDTNPRDLVLGFDQGGSTGDLYVCDAGTLTPQLMSHNVIGFNRILNWIMKSCSDQGCSVFDAKEIIKAKSFGEFIGNTDTLIKMIDDTVEDIINFIQREAGGKIQRIKHVFLTGGPSIMLKERLETSNLFNSAVKFYVSDNPEFSLAAAIADFEGI